MPNSVPTKNQTTCSHHPHYRMGTPLPSFPSLTSFGGGWGKGTNSGAPGRYCSRQHWTRPQVDMDSIPCEGARGS